jgi:mxaL protein
VCAHYQEIVTTLERLDWRMAWAGGSEVYKGAHFGIRSLSPAAALVFITDGHDAPPLRPKLRPALDSERAKGLIVGTGGSALTPIPKYDMAGNPLGYWEADEVVQTDAIERRSSQVDERLVSDQGGLVEAREKMGSEHLSSLREAHLQEIAQALQLGDHRLESEEGLRRSLASSELGRQVRVETPIGWIGAIAALLCLIVGYGLRLRP